MAIVRIQWRRGTAAHWTSTNPVLASGEAGYETDTGRFKLGDGTSSWTELGYAVSSYRLGELADVSTADAVDGSVLVFDEVAGQYVAGPLDTRLTLTDGGNW